jgi:hypothetical protein
VTSAPSLSIAFTNFDLNFSQTGAQTLLPAGTTLNAPNTLFQDLAFRQFIEHSYPYQSVQSEYNTVDGITTTSLYGGAIPNHMGNYYPTNISWDFTNPSSTGNDTAGWWWRQVESESKGIAATACTEANPCIFPFVSYTGDPLLDDIDNLWANESFQFSNGAVKIIPVDIAFTNLVIDSFSSIGANPLPLYNLYLTPNDYPDPTDGVLQLYSPDSTYTYGDALAESLGIFAGDCSAGYVWSIASVNESCQGTAYENMVSYLNRASSDLNLTERAFLYNAAEHIAQQLGIFVPNPGQSTAVWVAASWVSDSNASLNTNPAIGGNGDSSWYTIEYAPSLPTIDSFSAIPNPINLGSWTNFTVRANGGTGRFTYAYAGLPPGCYSADLAIMACDPTLPGTYSVTVNVTDQAYHSVTGSTTLVVELGASILSSVTISPTAVAVQMGKTTPPFTAIPTCSEICPAGATFSWALSNVTFGILSSGTGDQVTFTAGSKEGFVSLFVNATLDGATMQSAPVTITIYSSESPTLALVAITPGSGSVTVGRTMDFNVSVTCSGGPCPSGLSYAWSLSRDLGSLRPLSNQTMAFTAGSISGTVTLSVVVSLYNVTKIATAIIVISAPTATTGIFGLPMAEGYALLGGLLIVIAILGIGLSYRLGWNRHRDLETVNDDSSAESLTKDSANGPPSEHTSPDSEAFKQPNGKG